jgi:hypothetical protein
MVSTFKRPLQLAAIVALPVLLAARPLPNGTAYDFVVRTTSTQTGNKESVMMRGRGVFAGDNAKIEILDSGPMSGDNTTFGNKGSYFLMTEGGKKMLLVDPSQKSYLEWDMQSMMAGLAKMMNAVGGLVKMEMSDVKIDTQELGAGETVQGYPTRHVRMNQNYTVTARVFGKAHVSKTESTIDYYFAPALKAKNPFVQNSQAWANSFDMFNNPDYKSQMAAAQAKLTGVPVKTVVRTVSTDDKGKQQTSVVTSEMLNFKNLDVPKSEFEIPTGYQLVQMPTIDMPAAAAKKDSLDNKSGKSIGDAAAEGAKEGLNEGVKDATKDVTKDAVKDVTKEAAKEAAKKKLKGIFKR